MVPSGVGEDGRQNNLIVHLSGCWQVSCDGGSCGCGRSEWLLFGYFLRSELQNPLSEGGLWYPAGVTKSIFDTTKHAKPQVSARSGVFVSLLPGAEWLLFWVSGKNVLPGLQLR